MELGLCGPKIGQIGVRVFVVPSYTVDLDIHSIAALFVAPALAPEQRVFVIGLCSSGRRLSAVVLQIIHLESSKSHSFLHGWFGEILYILHLPA